jgi:hypothetical protein
MVCGGGSAVIWMAVGEPYGFTAAYLGWGVGMPVLVLVSLATQHSASENLNLFARRVRAAVEAD